MLPNMDHPEAFGQHPNADITSQIQETRLLFDILLSLQPQVSAQVGESREDKVMAFKGFFFLLQMLYKLNNININWILILTEY